MQFEFLDAVFDNNFDVKSHAHGCRPSRQPRSFVATKVTHVAELSSIGIAHSLSPAFGGYYLIFHPYTIQLEFSQFIGVIRAIYWGWQSEWQLNGRK